MTIKLVPAYTTDSCRWCHYSSGLETHSEDYAVCYHPAFDSYLDGRPLDDVTGDIQKWCPLSDV